MVLAPLPRLALIHQKITPALVSFDSLSGITRRSRSSLRFLLTPCYNQRYPAPFHQSNRRNSISRLGKYRVVARALFFRNLVHCVICLGVE